MHIDLPANPRLLLVRLSAIGDIANCLPAAAALRDRFPAARITWVADERMLPLLAASPDVDAFLPFPRGARDGSGLAARLASFFRNLKEQPFDAAIDLHGNFRSGLVAWSSRAPVRIGFTADVSREGNAVWLTHRVAMPAGTRHRTAQALALLAPLGIKPDRPRFRLAPDPAAAGNVRAWIDREFGTAPFLAIHPGASAKGAYKRWPADRFGILARSLADAGRPVALFRGPGEDPVIDETVAAAGRPFPVTPVFPLAETLAFLSRARLVIGSDSGPVNLAHALGRPVVAIFGPKDPAQYGPGAFPHRAVYRALPCSPCRDLDCPRRYCLDGISVEDVLRDVEALLAEI